MTLDEIFDSMTDAAADAGYEYLVIDPDSRSIIVPEAEKIFGVVSDENAVRKHFLAPRYVGDNLDLAGMFLTVYFRNANGEEDGYMVNDVQVVQGAAEYVTFSWELRPKVTAYQGTVQFSVCADLPNTGTHRRPDWNTTTAQGEVLDGLHPDAGDVEGGTSDVVAQLREMVTTQTAAVEATGAAQVAAVKAQGNNTTQEAVAAIQAQGAATVASIPADYTDLAATVDRLTRDRAAAIVCQAEGTAIQVTDASNDPLQGLRIFGRSTQDGTPTPEAPVEIVSTPTPVVGVYGKNLLAQTCVNQTISGVTFTKNADGSITANGTSTGVFTYQINGKLTGLQKGKKYTLTGNPRNSADYMLYFDQKDANGNNLGSCQDYGQGKTMEIAANYSHLLVGIFAQAGVTFDGLTFYPMLRLAEIEDDTYEPYTGQTMTITTPGILPGIPVASGGNYTDESGQQWIADEVDLARGVYVHRILRKTISDFSKAIATEPTNGHTEGYINNGVHSREKTGGLCNRFPYAASGHFERFGLAGAMVYFTLSGELTTDEWRERMTALSPTIFVALKDPTETPLTDVELQAYLAMHSNKPTTTVLNAAGAHMALEYAADPKTYIDNKLAALVAANG